MSSPLSQIKTQGAHVPTLAYAIGATLLVLGLYHLAHRRR